MNGIVIALACLLITVSARTESARDRLTRDLLATYSSGVDPGNTDLVFGVTILCANFDNETGIATLNAWEFHKWTDTRLSWNPEEYSGIQELRISTDQLWTPDMRLYNSLTADESRGSAIAVVIANGSVYWIPPSDYQVYCKRGENEATCKLRIGSWTYNANQLVLSPRNTGVDLSFYDEACPSVITSHTVAVSSATYPCCKEPYASLDLNLTVRSREDPAES